MWSPADLILERGALQTNLFCRTTRAGNLARSSLESIDDGPPLGVVKVGHGVGARRSRGVPQLSIGTYNSLPCVRMTARSMRFCNSRTLPGHETFAKTSIACLGTDLVFFLIRRDCLETKY